MARVGVMGGSFDPIHLGHLVAANEVAQRLDLDSVVFVPAGLPWQKGEITSAQDRLHMVQLAIANNPKFEVSRCDIDRAGPSYTVDTLVDLGIEKPGAELFFVGGSDAISAMESWHQAERIFDLATVVAVTRPGHKLEPKVGLKSILSVEIPLLEVSSTEIRRRVSNGEPIRYLVPDAVADYIFGKKLYLGGSVD